LPSGFTSIADPTLRIVAGWVAVFVAVLVVMALLRLAVRSLLKALGMTSDRSPAGRHFRCARGLVIVLVLVAVGGMTSLPKEKWWSEAYFSLRRSKRQSWPASPGCHPTWLNESGSARKNTMCGILGLSPPHR
jgi:uncharacterized membrane protein required for colicin V production